MESIAGFSVRQSGCAKAGRQRRVRAAMTAAVYIVAVCFICTWFLLQRQELFNIINIFALLNYCKYSEKQRAEQIN